MLYEPAAGAVKLLALNVPVESVTALGIIIGEVEVNVTVFDGMNRPVVESLSFPSTAYLLPCVTEDGTFRLQNTVL